MSVSQGKINKYLGMTDIAPDLSSKILSYSCLRHSIFFNRFGTLVDYFLIIDMKAYCHFLILDGLVGNTWVIGIQLISLQFKDPI